VRVTLPKPGRRIGATCTAILAVTTACGGAAAVVPEVPEPEPPEPTPASPVSGTLNVLAEPGADKPLGPVVVLLERAGRSEQPISGHQAVRVISTSALFDPPFTAVGAGDTVVLVNKGTLQHRFFSPDLEADLGSEVIIPVAPGGEYASVDFVAAGSKQIYCSLHPDETFTIFVSGTPFYAVLEEDGSYQIPEVPDGRYRLSIWSEVVSGPIRHVRIDANEVSVENIWLDSKRLTW
jgi:plastocyanin